MTDGSEQADRQSDLAGERSRELPELEELRTIGAASRHYANELSTLVRAGDPCIDEILAYKDADAAYHDAVHQSWEARLMHTIFHTQLRLDVLVRDHAILPSEIEEADRQIAKDKAGLERADRHEHEAHAALNAAYRARHQAVEALRECRRRHPYEHECGERGGPGIRRPDGKCAAWSDLEGTPRSPRR